MTADEIDRITPEERGDLMGFCDDCEKWFRINQFSDLEHCPECGEKYSQKHGKQLTTVRTFSDVRTRRGRKTAA